MITGNTPGNTCIVAILRDEEKFLDEWLIYHKLIGINHFFLYDDDPAYPLKEFLAPHSAYVTVIPWENQARTTGEMKNQLVAYHDALDRYLTDHEWVAFLDADEFIVLRKHQTIQLFLNDFKTASSISLNWHVFGHNGFFDDPKRLVTTSLTRRMASPSIRVKTISRVNAILNIPSPHHCNLKYGERVDGNQRIYSDELYSEKTEVAHINHYQSRSFKRWMKRVERGDVNFDKENSPPEHLWRLTEEACLKQFVTTIAKDKNEYIDTYMFKYRHEVYSGLTRINRKKADYLIKDEAVTSVIDIQLRQIANQIASGHLPLENIGLLKGKMGLAIFLLHYSKYSNISTYESEAFKMIDTISDTINKDTAINYSQGLAGYGTAIEYLVNHGFLNTNTNEILEDIDTLIHFHLVSTPQSDVDLNSGITGLGTYFLFRLNNCVNDVNHPSEDTNLQILREIVDLLETPYNTYEDLLSVIFFLKESYTHVNSQKLEAYLYYAIDKLETMLYEDTHFQINFDAAIPLNAAILLLEFAKTTKSDTIKTRGLDLIKFYRADHLKNVTHYDRLWMPYNELYRILKDEEFQLKRSEHLKIFLKQNAEFLNTLPDSAPSIDQGLCISSGLARIGLSLLSVVDNTISPMQLFPILSDSKSLAYYE